MKTPISLKQLMADDSPEQEWLIDGLVPMNGISIISSEPGMYKTWLLLTVCGVVSAGGKLFDTFETTRKRVLVIEEENGLNMLRDRFTKLDISPDSHVLILSCTGFKLEDDIRELIQLCATFEIGLVIFDPFVQVHNAEENSANEVSKVMAMFRQMTGFGLTILIAHHHRKSNGTKSNSNQDMRGSTDILAAVDSHIAINASDDSLTVAQKKSRYAEKLAPFDLDIVSDDKHFSFKYVGIVKPPAEVKKEKFLGLVFELAKISPGLTQSEIIKSLRLKIDMGEKRMISYLKEAVASNKLKSWHGKQRNIHYSLTDKTDENLDRHNGTLL